jgi:hypothetical protein
VPSSFDRADPDKDERECSDEFCEAGAKLIHASIQSDHARSDNGAFGGAALDQPPA